MPTLEQVNIFLGTTKDAREYKRAMAVKLLLLEFEPHDIAALLHVTESFVSKWKRLCSEHGTDVFVLKYHGYQGYLTPEQRQSITAALQDLPWEQIRVYRIRKAWKSSPHFQAQLTITRFRRMAF